MTSIFSFRRHLPTIIAIATALGTQQAARADQPVGSFDLSSLEPQAQVSGNFDGVAASGGQPTAPAVPAQNYVPSPSRRTSNQSLNLAVATRTILSQGGRQTLPVTNLDSFVYQSGMSDAIYGDEGQGGSIPPYMGMDESHTIGSGINSGGLTTGHSSNMPSAWCTYE
jgi:hypothetical protein